jgi:hypothetical protein
LPNEDKPVLARGILRNVERFGVIQGDPCGVEGLELRKNEILSVDIPQFI